MADAATAPAPKAAKSPKKKTSKPKKPSSHPKYCDMIAAAVASLKERGGSSRVAILKFILAKYNVGANEKTVNSHLKMALRAGVKNGTLKQAKGTGAAGSFRLGEKKTTKKPKAKKAAAAAAPKKAKKPKTAKPKKPKAKKAAKPKKPKAAKKPAAKKAAKPKKARTPKKAAKAKKAKASPKKK